MSDSFSLPDAFTVFVIVDIFRYLLACRHLPYCASKSGVLVLPWLCYVGAPNFFLKPYDYIARLHDQFAFSWLRFRARNHEVIVMFGSEARKKYFNLRRFSFSEGYTFLHPNVKLLGPTQVPEGRQALPWYIRHFMRADILEQCLSTEGVVDIYDVVDRVVFTIVSRVVASKDLAANSQKLQSAWRALAWVHKGSHPASLILPWLPTPSRVRTIIGGTTLLRMSSAILRERKCRQATSHMDVVQVLVDEDTDSMHAAMVMIGVIFAAHTNTSPVLCWLLIMLAQNPLWLSKIQDEIDLFFQLHNINGPPQMDSLAGMNLSLIEEALPSLDLCLHIIMNSTSIRRNVGEDLDIAGRKIRGRDFVM
ncbi:hypothetical protein POSPLADRAFT_1036625 [Postia placenta MAD-698-R-SB12]|uniref:Cytochrome P450 n=1 Tax=Postia placenta MAD-698-R-SB12 TaxID=670580 RepID=A0A1X6MPE4_9APHY|nr:hypothetical protein POSPLADRAFT_1036625 [Postia placenta MAD-698-R-SB12]OSX58096.1 hypothetical protein POSPLADRAFT_1036625 [Postia placenta MAD-698-R-SB12]